MAKQPVADLWIAAVAVPYNINGGHGFRRSSRMARPRGAENKGHHADTLGTTQAAPKNKVARASPKKLTAQPMDKAAPLTVYLSPEQWCSGPIIVVFYDFVNIPATFSDTQPKMAPTIMDRMMTTTGLDMDAAVKLPAPLPIRVSATTEAKP